ncbi:MAG: NAD(P)H-dependent oxidoreductase subunit E [Bacteroidales bacterium]
MNEILQHYRHNHREDLIPCMQEIQDKKGYMSEDSIAAIGEYFGLPATKVYGIATFYDYFTFTPVTGDVIRVCNGTSCHMQGSGQVMQEAKKAAQQLSSKTRSRFTVNQCECQGACSVGPVVYINDQTFRRVKPEDINTMIRRATAQEKGGDQ